MIQHVLTLQEKRQRYFVLITLALSLCFIVATPLSAAIYSKAIFWLIGFFISILLFALITRNFFDGVLAAALAVGFTASYLFFSQTDQRFLALRTCSTIAFILLNLTLLIGPWARFTKAIQKIYKHRRHMGVTVFLLGLMHFALLFGPYFNYSLNNAFRQFYTFFGFTALLVMFFLAITSWDWAQKHIMLEQWKMLHLHTLLIYLPLLGWALWLNYSQGTKLEPWELTLCAGFILFWIFVAPYGPIRKFLLFVNGWKQLHVLVYVAFAALIAHAWLAMISILPLWTKVAFWGLISFVVLSHTVGWIFKWKEDRALQEDQRKAHFITEKGISYRSAGKVEEYQENKGRRILVGKTPIAVFKYHNGFHAFLAVCAHQKGPLEQGKIVGQYLVCAWHGWQYSIKDGGPPPGYTAKVPYFPVITQNGIVYVAQIPIS